MCVAVPGRVEQLYRDNDVPMGTISFGGVDIKVCLFYVPDIQIGEYAIVHVGFAISRIDEASALETIRMLEELGVLQEELAELRETNEGLSPEAR